MKVKMKRSTANTINKLIKESVDWETNPDIDESEINPVIENKLRNPIRKIIKEAQNDKELVSKANELEQIIWRCDNKKAKKAWDDYTEQRVFDTEDRQYWADLENYELQQAIDTAENIIDDCNIKHDSDLDEKIEEAIRKQIRKIINIKEI